MCGHLSNAENGTLNTFVGRFGLWKLDNLFNLC